MPTSGDTNIGLINTTVPQDPYFPQDTPIGPIFLDTEACLCALQKPPEPLEGNAVWHCIGNQTESIYSVTGGKWFNTLHGGTDVQLPIYDSSNGPDNSTTLLWDTATKQLVSGADTGLSMYDKACTAVNQTTFSTVFYRAADELAKDQIPVDALPCWLPGAVPVQIQTAESWQSAGCLEGFFCT
jgi:hypothetical protein